MKWQPIETAPVDKEILGFWRLGDTSSTCGICIGEKDEDGYFFDDDGWNDPGLFTHWMPLPEPPEQNVTET